MARDDLPSDAAATSAPAHTARWPFVLHCVTGASAAAFDVLLKNAVIVFFAFRAGAPGQELGLVAALAWVLFMAPFFLFSAHGGYLGDRFDAKPLVVGLRCVDLAIAAAAAYGFETGNGVLLLALIFAKGTTATLYSPVKYALVADLLPQRAHGIGYALVEAGSMAAILAATYLGALLGADPDHGRIGLVIVTLVGISLVLTGVGPGWPKTGPRPPPLGLDPVRPTLEILRRVLQDRRLLAAILALAWYWGLGAVYLSNVAVLVRDVLHRDESTIATILVVFTLGCGLGLAAGAIVNRRPLARHLPYATAALIVGAGLDLVFAIPLSPRRMLVDFFLVAASSGLYASYFSAVLYRFAHRSATSRIFAANNIASALAIVSTLTLSTILGRLHFPVATCLTMFAVATLPLTLIVVRLLDADRAATSRHAAHR
ncbi:MFS transporter [Segnochrobactrum spirostomi]|uniref:MFS transporter n=1 Tax=Segnochrobactrum spirostomi TaxID=2608987 RepID=A0A6A7Y7R4_9HYPH|nr:MFS transporter [Segnochrobactrum spirostomi]MQT14886.1 MFS transporter [Segnochrobactrum spirostomi]